VTPLPALDPFTVFGVARSLDLDDRTLERRYLALSRECHPDLLRTQATADCLAVLQRSAEINDAWKVLRDPWQRARALLEAASPGVLARNEKLDAAFLANALELAEEVAFAHGDAIARLRTRLTDLLDADFTAVRAHVERGEFDGAAKRFHGAHYHRKALADLDKKA
jgi:Fe-S protein assembly co-chaperone HscB